MSQPREPDRCTRIFGVLLGIGVDQRAVKGALARTYASLAECSEPTSFCTTAYYEREMGTGLRRFFASCEGWVEPDRLAELKLAANALEGAWVEAGRRRVNIDPGLLSLQQVVLASGKQAAHRIYLGRGVYAEVEHVYEHGSFRPLPWTYPDYREPVAIDFFNQVRERHKVARRKGAAVLGPLREQSCP